MNLNVGDFIKTNFSQFPSLIVQKGENKHSNLLLVTIHEYSGDYAWIVNNNDLKLFSFKPEEELSIVVNYGNWFRESHKNLFQEILLKNICKK